MSEFQFLVSCCVVLKSLLVEERRVLSGQMIW